MLKMYMGYDVADGGSGGSVLVFAHNSNEARKLAYPFIHDWLDARLKDVRTRLLTAEHLRAEGIKAKLDADIPHVIDDPLICLNCELWGSKPIILKNGTEICEGCMEEYENETGIELTTEVISEGASPDAKQ